MAEGREGGREGGEEGEREEGGRERGRGMMPAALTTPRMLRALEGKSMHTRMEGFMAEQPEQTRR